MGEPAVSTLTPARCPLCGRSGAERIATHPEFAGTAIFSCQECTFAFGAPAPSDAELADYYQKTYPKRRTWSTQPEYLTLMQRRAVAQVQFFSAELPQIRQAIDVGCGVGALVAELTRRGVEAVGYDSDDTVIRVGRARWGANIHHGHVRGREAAERFDLLCLSHVVEHFPRPVEDLRALVGQVRPGGWIFLEVPHCIPWMFTEGVETESHLGFFTPTALRRMAGECGLAVTRVENCGPPIIDHYRIRGNRQADAARRTMVTRWIRGGARRLRSVAARVLPSVWRLATEYDGFFDTYYQPGDERGLWIRALLQRPAA